MWRKFYLKYQILNLSQYSNQFLNVLDIIYQFFDFGFQEENNNYLKYSLFLARCLCFSKNLNFLPYDEWFNQFWLKYRDFYKIKLFWNLLIELVPYDTYDILSIQISKVCDTGRFTRKKTPNIILWFSIGSNILNQRNTPYLMYV